MVCRRGTPTRRTLRIDGLDLAYLDTGAPRSSRAVDVDAVGGTAEADAGESTTHAVVLVHGLGMSTRSFRPLLATLRPDYRVLAIDLPGCGNSQTPARADQPTAEWVAELLWRWLGEVGAEQVTLLGHSLGAQVVTRMAAGRPAAVRLLVLAAPCPDPAGPRRWRAAARLVIDGLQEPPRLIWYAVTDYLRARPHRMWSTFKRSVAAADPDRMRAVRSPVLILRGDRDGVCSPTGTSLLRQRFRIATTQVIPGGTHGLPFQSAREVAAAVRTAQDTLHPADQAAPRDHPTAS